jgi:decaprenylphospho-beta-D-erythro-pentofuranosid-2-ulose 2-reductase
VKPKKVVITGATAEISKQCARLWASGHPESMVLLGRSQEKLDEVARELRDISPVTEIETVVADFINSDRINEAVERICTAQLPDVVFIAHALFPDHEACLTNLDQCHEALQITGISPVLFAEAFARHMQNGLRNTIAIMGSVSGDRGRKSNYIYGAAKGLVHRYAQGMQHRFAGTTLKIVLIKPGPTTSDTNPGKHRTGVRLANIEYVARDIVQGIADETPVIYTPGRWYWIMQLVRHIPAFIFNRTQI